MPSPGQGRLGRRRVTVPSTIRRSDLSGAPLGDRAAHLESSGPEASSRVVREPQVVGAHGHIGCRVELGPQAPAPDAVAAISNGPEPDATHAYTRRQRNPCVPEGPDSGADVAVPVT